MQGQGWSRRRKEKRKGAAVLSSPGPGPAPADSLCNDISPLNDLLNSSLLDCRRLFKTCKSEQKTISSNH